jgi:hypothetical protein
MLDVLGLARDGPGIADEDAASGLFGLDEQRVQVERQREHRDALLVGWARPVLDRTVAVGLEPTLQEQRTLPRRLLDRVLVKRSDGRKAGTCPSPRVCRSSSAATSSSPN